MSWGAIVCTYQPVRTWSGVSAIELLARREGDAHLSLVRSFGGPVSPPHEEAHDQLVDHGVWLGGVVWSAEVM